MELCIPALFIFFIQLSPSASLQRHQMDTRQIPDLERGVWVLGRGDKSNKSGVRSAQLSHEERVHKRTQRFSYSSFVDNLRYETGPSHELGRFEDPSLPLTILTRKLQKQTSDEFESFARSEKSSLRKKSPSLLKLEKTALTRREHDDVPKKYSPRGSRRSVAVNFDHSGGDEKHHGLNIRQSGEVDTFIRNVLRLATGRIPGTRERIRWIEGWRGGHSTRRVPAIQKEISIESSNSWTSVGSDNRALVPGNNERTRAITVPHGSSPQSQEAVRLIPSPIKAETSSTLLEEGKQAIERQLIGRSEPTGYFDRLRRPRDNDQRGWWRGNSSTSSYRENESKNETIDGNLHSDILTAGEYRVRDIIRRIGIGWRDPTTFDDRGKGRMHHWYAINDYVSSAGISNEGDSSIDRLRHPSSQGDATVSPSFSLSTNVPANRHRPPTGASGLGAVLTTKVPYSDEPVFESRSLESIPGRTDATVDRLPTRENSMELPNTALKLPGSSPDNNILSSDLINRISINEASSLLSEDRQHDVDSGARVGESLLSDDAISRNLGDTRSNDEMIGFWKTVKEYTKTGESDMEGRERSHIDGRELDLHQVQTRTGRITDKRLHQTTERTRETFVPHIVPSRENQGRSNRILLRRETRDLGTDGAGDSSSSPSDSFTTDIMTTELAEVMASDESVDNVAMATDSDPWTVVDSTTGDVTMATMELDINRVVLGMSASSVEPPGTKQDQFAKRESDREGSSFNLIISVQTNSSVLYIVPSLVLLALLGLATVGVRRWRTVKRLRSRDPLLPSRRRYHSDFGIDNPLAADIEGPSTSTHLPGSSSDDSGSPGTRGGLFTVSRSDGSSTFNTFPHRSRRMTQDRSSSFDSSRQCCCTWCLIQKTNVQTTRL